MITSRWLGETARQVRRGKHVLLHGNVRDLALVRGGFMHVLDALDTILGDLGYTLQLRYNVVDGLRCATTEMRPRLEALLRGAAPPPPSAGSAYRPPGRSAPPPSPPPPTGLPRLDDPRDALPALRTVLGMCHDECCAAVFEFADKLVPGGENQAADERQLLVLLDRIASEAHRHTEGDRAGVRNVLILCAPSLGQVPAWLYRDNPFIHVVAVTRPDRDERAEYLSQFHQRFYGAPAGALQEDLTQRFADLTDGLSLWDLEALRLTSHHEALPITALSKLVDFFKHGQRDDPWEKLSLSRLQEARDRLSQRIIGQAQAVQSVLNVLVSARGGITVEGAERRSARPKGVLFFVGPTGVGKTELAKAMTELVFGDERAFARFDMSEYAQEHAAERLTGAPPSYIGYEAGGQLTNHMKTHPFSLLLFDEIEKAHPRVMDKFLQVLDDGRLTDGQGETVYFSQSVIVFTSNIGSTRVERTGAGHERVTAAISPDLSYDELEAHYRREVRDHFVRIGRPELLGRIGEENIVVFDVLRPACVAGILRKFLDGIAGSARARHGIEIQFDDTVAAQAEAFCSRPDNAMLGGRGLRNFVVSQLLPALNDAALRLPGGTRRLLLRHDGRCAHAELF